MSQQLEETVKPKITDQYWFDKSKDMVDGRGAVWSTAIETIRNFFLWLWTAYTTAVTLGLSFSDTYFPDSEIAIILAPVFILIFGYLTTVVADMPFSVKFDARSPTQIRDAYYRGASKKRFLLLICLLIAMVGSASVAMAIRQISIKNQKVPTKITHPKLSATFQKSDDKNVKLISVVGHVPDLAGLEEEKRAVDILVSADETLVIHKKDKANANGTLTALIPISFDDGVEYRIRLRYGEEEPLSSIEKELIR